MLMMDVIDRDPDCYFLDEDGKLATVWTDTEFGLEVRARAEGTCDESRPSMPNSCPHLAVMPPTQHRTDPRALLPAGGQLISFAVDDTAARGLRCAAVVAQLPPDPLPAMGHR